MNPTSMLRSPVSPDLSAQPGNDARELPTLLAPSGSHVPSSGVKLLETMTCILPTLDPVGDRKRSLEAGHAPLPGLTLGEGH